MADSFGVPVGAQFRARTVQGGVHRNGIGRDLGPVNLHVQHGLENQPEDSLQRPEWLTWLREHGQASEIAAEEPKKRSWQDYFFPQAAKVQVPSVPPPPAAPETTGTYHTVAAEELRDLVSSLIQAASAEEIGKLFSDASELKDHVWVEPSADGCSSVIVLDGLVVAPDPKKEFLTGLDLSGMCGNVRLFIQNCRMEFLDLSRSQFHSVLLFGVQAPDGSVLKDFGTRVRAYDLILTGDFVTGAFYTDKAEVGCKFFFLLARGLKAREVVINSSTRFTAGIFSFNYLLNKWKEAGGKLKRANADESFSTLFPLASQAFQLSRAIDLTFLSADTLVIQVKCDGSIELSDSEISRTVRIFGGKYSNTLLERKDALYSCVSAGAKNAQEAAEKVIEFSRRLCPALSLQNLRCSGELQFLSLSREYDSGGIVAGVFGHVNLAGTKTRIFTDDETWWKDRSEDELLTYDLLNFEYELFGKPLLAKVQGDMQEQAGRPQEGKGKEANTDKSVSTRGQNHGSKGKTIQDDLGERKSEWLRGGHIALEGAQRNLDAQPYTQCARVLRLAGWRKSAEDVLYEREKYLSRIQWGKKWTEFALELFWPFILLLSVVTVYLSLVNLPKSSEKIFEPSWLGGFVILVIIIVAVFGVWAGGFRKILDIMIWLSVGFGYRRSRALLASLATIIIGTFIFNWAYHVDPRLMMRNPEAKPQIGRLAGGDGPQGGGRGGVQPQAPAQAPAPGAGFSQSGKSYLDCEGADREECAAQGRVEGVPMAQGTSPQQDPDASKPETPAAPPAGSLPPAGVGGQSDGKPVSGPAPGNAPPAQGAAAAQTPPAPDASAYPRFNSFMYSLDVFIPIIDFGQAIYWLPGREGAPKEPGGDQAGENWLLFLVWVWYWLQIAAGWWFSSILLAALTGLLERKE